jgi:hypothetical protein
MKITVLEESADFATLDTGKLLSKLKSIELFRNGRPNHGASLMSKAFITSAHVGGNDANPTNTTVSSALEFALSSLAAASDDSTRASPMTRSPYWRGSSMPCTSSARKGGDHRGVASSAMIPPTSSPIAPSTRSQTPPTSTTTTTGMTLATRVTKRRSTASRTTRRRSSRRSYPERVLPSVTLTYLVHASYACIQGHATLGINPYPESQQKYICQTRREISTYPY